MNSDGEIARAAQLKPIAEIGAKLGIPAQALIPYGHTKAKMSADFLKSLAARPDGDLVLVTAMNPTPAEIEKGIPRAQRARIPPVAAIGTFK